MAFQAARPRGNINPSAPQPASHNVSYSSELTNSIHPPSHIREDSEPYQEDSGNRPRLPSLSIRDRGLSIASSTSSTSSVRRKPLPLTASPLATRYSSADHLTGTLELPEQDFIRPYSVDSPTLYDFPPTPANPYTPSARFSAQPTYTRYVCTLL
jgi:hypothetical protein